MAGESIGIIDLDAVLKPDIKVKLDGQEYKLPGDPPTEILLTIVNLSERMAEAREGENPDAMLEIRAETTDAVTDLFGLRQEVDDDFGTTLVNTQISELVNKLFAHYYPGLGGGGEDDADPPTDPPEGDKTPPKSRSSAPSRRRSSSGRRKRAAASASSKS